MGALLSLPITLLNFLLPFTKPGTPILQDLVHTAILCGTLYYGPQIAEWYNAQQTPQVEQPGKDRTAQHMKQKTQGPHTIKYQPQKAQNPPLHTTTTPSSPKSKTKTKRPSPTRPRRRARRARPLRPRRRLRPGPRERAPARNPREPRRGRQESQIPRPQGPAPRVPRVPQAGGGDAPLAGGRGKGGARRCACG